MKKYILKPGKHQFVPGEHARHDNETLTDAEAEWYLERYPHIAKLFVDSPEVGKRGSPKETTTRGKRKRTGVITPKICEISSIICEIQKNEDLSATN